MVCNIQWFLCQNKTSCFLNSKHLILCRSSDTCDVISPVNICSCFHFPSLCHAAAATTTTVKPLAQPCLVSTEEATCLMWSTVPAVERGSRFHLISVYSAAPQLPNLTKGGSVCVGRVYWAFLEYNTVHPLVGDCWFSVSKGRLRVMWNYLKPDENIGIYSWIHLSCFPYGAIHSCGSSDF